MNIEVSALSRHVNWDFWTHLPTSSVHYLEYRIFVLRIKLCGQYFNQGHIIESKARDWGVSYSDAEYFILTSLFLKEHLLVLSL